MQSYSRLAERVYRFPCLALLTLIVLLIPHLLHSRLLHSVQPRLPAPDPPTATINKLSSSHSKPSSNQRSSQSSVQSLSLSKHSSQHNPDPGHHTIISIINHPSPSLTPPHLRQPPWVGWGGGGLGGAGRYFLLVVDQAGAPISQRRSDSRGYWVCLTVVVAKRVESGEC